LLNILELEIGLTNKDVDLVVHSLKDLPSTLPEDMVIGAIMERVDPRDSVIMKNCPLDPLQSNQTAVQRLKTLNDLPKGSILGTSAVRRGAQLRASYPNLGKCNFNRKSFLKYFLD
jgi:hydroxymethylbilane synthase